jgi:transcriptional regulator with XRE-family HTH domain
VDVPLVIKHRLKELGLEQKDLAVAAQVTESYISQLLARKKSPPAPNRTDIYDKIGAFLKMPSGELSKLAEIQRKEDWKRRVADPPIPLFREFRELILGKCDIEKRKQVRVIFEKEPFGELERLITQKLLDVAKRVARDELKSEDWLRRVARLSKRSYEQMRVVILEFLDTDVFNVSLDNCVSFLDPLIESWDIDLKTFSVEIVLNDRLAARNRKRFEFRETEPEPPVEVKAGLEEFLKDTSLSGDVTKDEIDFLRALTFKGRRPTALFYYRSLQTLRDPLHFRTPPIPQKPARGKSKQKTAERHFRQ